MARYTVPNRSERNAGRRPTSPRANGVADGVVRRRQAVARDVLDASVLLPGRFEGQVRPDRLDVRGREGVLRIHAVTKLLSPTVDFIALARRTAGFSGAELVDVVNEAERLATHQEADLVSPTHFFEAIESVRAARVPPKPPAQERRPAALVTEQLASFRDIGNWLSPGLAGGL